MQNEEFLNGVFHHLEQIAFARNSVEALRPPEELINIRTQHVTYLTNAWSLFELLKEKYCAPFEAEVRLNVAVLGHDGDDILGYARELRNSVVHRGMDPVATGVVIADIIRVVAPEEVVDRTGKKKFRPHAQLLVDVIDHLVVSTKNSSRTFLEPDILSLSSIDRGELVEMHRRRVLTDPSIPEWAKEMAIKTTTDEMLYEAILSRTKLLRAHLL